MFHLLTFRSWTTTTTLGCLLALTLAPVSRQEEATREGSGGGKLLLVSFDGFRWDYINRVPTPNFDAIMRHGVQVERVRNTYVTKSLPNHYSLVTGLHAESHGMVANQMLDRRHNRSFSLDAGPGGAPEAHEPRWWEQAVPLWVTNQRAGGRSGAAMWPGSDVAIHGVYPTHYVPYNASVPFQSRVERLLSWFSGPEPIDFGVLYWEEPDESGHNLGPESPLLDVVIADIDQKLGFLLEELRRAGLEQHVNLVVTSDHGMTQLSHDKIIELDSYVSRDLYTWVDSSPVVGLIPKEGAFDEVYLSLLNANPNLYVYKREDVPEHYHYRHNDRIMPIILEAREGWTIVPNKTKKVMLGNHGYNNSLPSMHPVFVARGPALQRGYTKDAMDSVDLYPLMCYILGVRPLPNNGSLARVQDLLLDPPPPTTPCPTPAPRLLLAPWAKESPYAWVVELLLGTSLVVFFLFLFVKQVTWRQTRPALPQHINREISKPLLYEELQL